MKLKFFLLSISLVVLVLAFLFLGCKNKQAEEAVSTEEPVVRTETILNNRGIIWGMDFLPSGQMLFTEKEGKLFKFFQGQVTEISGMPAVHSGGQGGLLDIRVHPNYAQNGWIYICYSTREGTPSRLNLMRFKLVGNTAQSQEIIFQTDASNTWSGHYGSRIEFDKNGLLYLSVGEGGAGSRGGENSNNTNAQNLQSKWGKIHRLNDDGSTPTDNPIFTGQSQASSIFSYGHRNPQGLVLNPFTNEIWSSEHGPSGGDEINIIKKGKNYGWHLVSWGVNYDGSPISNGHNREGIENPIFYWDSSLGASGIAFINNKRFKAWHGNLLCGSLAKRYLSRLVVENNKIIREHKLLENNRVRNVKQAPDGSIYVSVEGPGRIIRISVE